MVEFRSATKNDIHQIAALHAKSWQENYRGTFSDYFLNEQVELERLSVWRERIESPPDNQFVFVAEVSSEFVGFVCGYKNRHPKYGTLVDNLHVDSRFIGRRIGEQLMRHTARFLKQENQTSMYLWVLAGNKKAIKFYERIGGRAVETIDDFDIGDREITKTRYFWPDLTLFLSTRDKKTTNEY